MNRMEEIWIRGTSGRVGRKMTGELEETGAEILLTDMGLVDMTNSKDVINYVGINRPYCIISCIRAADVAACKEQVELAYRVNVLGARNLSVAARRIKARMAQLSTDDVFDGSSETPYTEFDASNPQAAYERLRLVGENFVREFCNRYIVVRSSRVFGGGNNYMQKILGMTKEGKEISATRDRTAPPAGAMELAGKVIELMEYVNDGLYHVTGQGCCSRYEFAREVIHLSDYNAEVRPVDVDEDKLTLMWPSHSVLGNFMFRIPDTELPPSRKDTLERYMTERRER